MRGGGGVWRKGSGIAVTGRVRMKGIEIVRENPMSFVIHFREEDAFSLALEDFVKICGFKHESKKHKKMFESAMKIREQGIYKVDIKALLSVYGPDIIHENYLEVDGIKLYCDALIYLDREKINKVLCYIMTIGECGCESGELMDRLYADLWGTAYVNASYELFREEIHSRYIKGSDKADENRLMLSDAFGPGYYGMPTEEMKNFFKIMDAEKIGVKCRPSFIMTPLKSCAGILFVMEKGARVPEEHCKHCAGNSKGCGLCHMKQA